MKVIILAGGWGTRLGRLSESIPKPMVSIGEKPILWHIMNYYSSYGHNEFFIALGVKGDIIKNYFCYYDQMNRDIQINLKSKNLRYLSNDNELDWKITMINTGIDTLKGGRIKRLEKYIKDEICMLTYGDGLADVDLNKLLDFHKSHKKLVTVTGVTPPGRFGQINEKNNKVISFIEKPKTSKELINGGYMVFNRALFNYLTEDEDCDFEFGPLEELAEKGEVMVYKHHGSFACMDHERDVTHLNALWNQNKSFWKR